MQQVKKSGRFVGQQLFNSLGISRQAYYQHLKKTSHRQQAWMEMEIQVQLIRSEHPAMSLREIYRILKPAEVGRDKFEKYFLSKGYRVKKKKNYVKTTKKGGFYWRYHNLMEGRQIRGINQVWVSDITYFLVKGKFYYITLVMDVFSRRIIGYDASGNMYAVSVCKALQMAFKTRKIKDYKDSLIHHSDRGSQYMSELYTGLLESYGCRISIATSAYENSHIERVNGTIKNSYLRHWRINTRSDLVRELARAVKNYNETRPHSSLPYKKPPLKFERSLLHLDAQELPTVKLYTEARIN